MQTTQSSKNIINKDMLVGEILELHSGVAAILFKSGLHCLGCPSSAMETLEEAGFVHGLDVSRIVDEINQLLAA